MTRRPGTPSIMIVAGEASGDLHGAGLCAALRARAPEARVSGMGGERMRAAGAELLADVSRGAGVGTTEVASSVPGLYRVYRRLCGELRRDPPSVLVLIDFPEFNLRLARTAARVGIPVVYFIPPQVWVWRRWRIAAIRRLISLVLVPFPFERALYADAGVPVEFVGHPALDAVAAAPSRAEARRALGLPDTGPVIGLLPGSRHGEAAGLIPVMCAAVARLAERWPGARFLLGQAATLDDGFVARALAGAPSIRVVRDAAYTVMRAADVLLVASGTATLEAGLLGTPMVVCYPVSRTTELMARLLVRVPWINLVNLTLGRAVVPELRLRHELTVDRLVGEATRLLDDEAAMDRQREAFEELRGQLGEPGAYGRAAQFILGGGLRPPRALPSAPSDAPRSLTLARRCLPPGQDCAGGARARTSDIAEADHTARGRPR